MNIKIPAPHGCKASLISLVDIIRVENRSINFSNGSSYNLYIIEKVHKGEEYFTLYSYKQKKDMLFAYDTINSLLKEKKTEAVTLVMAPMKASI